MRDLKDAGVVITGASSGIGRATARRFAAEGARLVLAARAEEPLRAVAAECAYAGAVALPLATDVRSQDAVSELARHAAERLGRIDVWVNAAGVMAYGRFEEVPEDVFRAVIETNFFGQVHGARAVLPYFRAQGSGVLVNLNSIWGRVTTPQVSAYVASKFALRGFTECLRQELRAADGIDVAMIMPQAVDTPIFARAGNFTGRAVRAVPPIFDPDTIAEGIVRCARSPRRETTYGWLGRGLEALHAVLPVVHHRILPAAFEAGTFAGPPADRTAGGVLEPVPRDYGVDGGWRSTRRADLARAFGATVFGAARAAIRGR